MLVLENGNRLCSTPAPRFPKSKNFLVRVYVTRGRMRGPPHLQVAMEQNRAKSGMCG